MIDLLKNILGYNMPDKEIKLKSAQALEILSKNTSDIVFTTAISTLSIINPIWSILFLTAKGIYGAWSDFGQARVNELVINLEKHKDAFNIEILETDKFKSIFLSILERHMKESSNERRHLLRNYLISVSKGENPDFDYHTKLLNILDQITGEELRLFMLLPNIINDSNDEFFRHSTEEIQKTIDLTKREIDMNTLQVKMRLKDWKIKTRDLTSIIRFLTNYGIISTYDVSIVGLGGGGKSDIIFTGLTNVGKVFYNYIDDSIFDKEITPWTAYRDSPGLSVVLQD